METGLSLFLLWAAGISLITGVMVPGPLTAATIAKGYGDKNAGALIAVGHAVIEIPLIAAIYLGLGHLIGSPQVVKVIYVVGGLMLFYLGFRVFRTAGDAVGEIGGLPTSSLVTGIVFTGANPGFYIWWVTIGMVVIVGAIKFGLVGIVLFTVVHWLCDLAWYEVLSAGTFKSRKWWTQKVRRIVFSGCAFVLIGFGVWFCISAFL
ncbi:MAG: LysE family translocator [Dehalococcoidia bacterium]|nr:LysE family translocator [Dehalococcoidia bacterium]MDH5780954.1 LysE family translocator [Dehalococcoidia bacterium]